MISGGVCPDECSAWFDAGTAFVGMGGGLVGRDVSLLTPPEHGEEGWDGMDESRDFFEALLNGRV